MDPPDHRLRRRITVPVEPDAHPDQLLMALEDEREPDDSIQTAFEKFDRENPHVYGRLVDLALEWYDAGHPKCSIGMLFEVLRWQTGLTTRGEEYVLNNNYRSRYARKIMLSIPELDGFFEIRELQAP